MLTEADRQIAKEFQRRLSVITLCLISVYSVHGRGGKAADDSDMDMFIELEALDSELREKIFGLAWEVGFETDRVITTIVTTHEQLQYGAMGANPLIRHIKFIMTPEQLDILISYRVGQSYPNRAVQIRRQL